MLSTVVAILIAASGTVPHSSNRMGGGTVPHRGANIKLVSSFGYTGQTIQNDSNTVDHIRWTVGMIDDYGHVWTQHGSPPLVTTSPFYPNGFSTNARAGGGPYSASNYFQLGTGSDILDFAGDFSACISFSTTDSSTQQVVFSDYNPNNAGYLVQVYSGSVRVDFYEAISHELVAGSPVTNGPNVICFGRAGTTGYAKLNLGTIVTGSTGPITPATTSPATIGIGSALTLPFTGGTIYELWFSTTTPSDALFTAIESRYFGMTAETGQQLAVTRATTATDVIGGTLYTWPSGVARVDANGLLVEPASTNVALYSQQFNTAPWTKNAITVTDNAAASPSGATAASQLVETTATAPHVDYQPYTATAATWTGSVFAKAGTRSWLAMAIDNTNYSYFNLSNGTVGTTNGNTASITSIGGGWYRCQISRTLLAGATDFNVGLASADNTLTYAGAITNNIYVYGMQVEQQPGATSYIATTGTAVTRNSDSLSYSRPPMSFALSDYSMSADAILEFENPSIAQGILGTDVNYIALFGNPGAVAVDGDTTASPATLSVSAATKIAGGRWKARRKGNFVYAGFNDLISPAHGLSTTPTEPTTVYVGYSSGTTQTAGWIKNICIAASYGGCY